MTRTCLVLALLALPACSSSSYQPLLPDGTADASADPTGEGSTDVPAEGAGDVLAFLPGAGEIERVCGLLRGLEGVDVVPLYGALPFARQRAVLRPGARRRVILATAIAETSLTVPGVRTVVDAGRSRRALHSRRERCSFSRDGP